MRRGSLLVLGALLAACTTSSPATPTPPSTPSRTPGPTQTPAPTQTPPQTSPPQGTPSPTPTSTPRVFAELPGAIDSPGCSLSSGSAGDSTLQVDVNGVARSYLLHMPEGLADGRSVPLVLILHGTFLDGQAMADLTGFSGLADERGFLVAYPDPTSDFPGWNVLEAADLPDDIAFISRLLDELEATYCVDQRRIFAAGFSAGGTMAHTAACRDARIAAVSMVSSGFAVGEAMCEPEAGIPTVVIQGLLDPLIPWLGGRNPLPEFGDAPPVRAVPEWTADIAAQNGCEGDPLDLAQIGDWVVPFEWHACTAATILYRVANGGHNWPGGSGLDVFGSINQDIDASEVSYDFFLESTGIADARSFSDPEGAYVVHLQPEWQQPLAGQFLEGNPDEASVTFPVDRQTMIVVSSGPIAEGVPSGAGIVQGSNAQELADALLVLHPDWVWSPNTMDVDGEPIVTLRGTAYIAYVASFTHRDRAFLVYVLSDVAGISDTRPLLATFLRQFEFTD